MLSQVSFSPVHSDDLILHNRNVSRSLEPLFYLRSLENRAGGGGRGRSRAEEREVLEWWALQ